MKVPERRSMKLALWLRVLALPALLLIVIAAIVIGQRHQVGAQNSAAPEESFGHHEILPSQLPPPNATRSASNPPRVISRPAGATLRTPPGFKVETWAEGQFEEPRWLALAPNGDVFLADSRAGRILVLRDAKNSGRADQRFVFAEDLQQPFGMAFWKDYLYVGDTNAVLRFRYTPGQTKAEGAPEKIADLPGRGYNQHWTRNLAFSPDGTKLYVTVGSASNDSPEEPPRAAITQMNPDGSERHIFASGTRNPIGMAFYPGTSQLWAVVQERDDLGDDLVPDYLTRIQEGGFYGWPYAYAGAHADPENPQRPDLVKKTITPDVLVQAHSATMDVVFYDGGMFPKEYRGDAFVSMHGSWNRSRRTGYKIVRVRFQNGKPAGGYDDFITGWMLSPERREVWGRPAGMLVLKDGSLLIADDGGNKIWRVIYGK